ncbi:hypothetical protein M378DRAFT_509292 [Amanita muscaria Koide BX008]|uniref:Uncharacterized protein n=1 Tax=Amanita muscaria (strain Koide BX008) TaxID=946122 RepID=A0A0C2XNC1_AMAMK|nr:hypothetical protein M378DRAFT_509292 [Amanita muscaria Koide BX008]
MSGYHCTKNSSIARYFHTAQYGCHPTTTAQSLLTPLAPVPFLPLRPFPLHPAFSRSPPLHLSPCPCYSSISCTLSFAAPFFLALVLLGLVC